MKAMIMYMDAMTLIQMLYTYNLSSVEMKVGIHCTVCINDMCY